MGIQDQLKKVDLTGKSKSQEDIRVKRSYEIKASTEIMLKELQLKRYSTSKDKVSLGDLVDEAIRMFCENEKRAE